MLGQYRIVPEEIEFQSPWIRFAHDFLREVADAVDNEFQSPWIRFAPASAVPQRDQALPGLVSIPVDKVRAGLSSQQAGAKSMVFQSPWIRFALEGGESERFYPAG